MFLLQRLAKSEAELKEKYPKIQTRVVSADFSRTDAKLYTDIKAAISGLDIGVLVSGRRAIVGCVH